MNKKIIASVLAVAFAFSMVGSASAVTVEELQALYNDLLAKYELLLAQVGQPTGAAAVCFNTDLQKGMTSNDVKNLQIVLNKNVSTQVASSGAGSPGNETTYFGSLTFAAVKNFQTSKGIINTGYVGPLTRGALNALYCSPVPTTTTTTVPPISTTTTTITPTTTTTTTTQSKCTELNTILTNAYGSKCGDAKYNKVADVDNSKKIDFDDLMIFATNAQNEAWCKEQLEKIFNPCDIPSNIGEQATKLLTILTNAYGSQCGDAKYNPVADFGGYLGDPQKDGKVNFEDLMIFATNAENETWCQEQLSINYNPCTIGEQSRKLLNILYHAYGSKCGDDKYNPIADFAGNGGATFNPAKDGKVNFEDLMVFAVNAHDESWCQEHLELRIHLFNPCPYLTTTTTRPITTTTTTIPPTTTTTTITPTTTTTTTAQSKCTELNTVLTNAYGSQCGDEKYNPIADFGGYLGDPQKDGKVDFEDLMIFATNSTNETWCKEQLQSTINPCEIILGPINSINDALSRLKAALISIVELLK
ncbi:MAG TPA: hypothetical protein ENN45_03850 [Bacteroidetes bacterium]|nr:hypothetical protein [Bacteroidota bacterium]